MIRPALLALALSLTAGAAVAACPPGVPEGVACGEKNAALATAGDYVLDASHTSVIARVSHIGYSYSTFRFGKAEGRLTWDPAVPARSKLTVSVDTASIATPVDGFAAKLAGDDFLKSAAFPQATFVSSAFRRTSPTTGKVEGQLTFLGQTRPLTFDVELVGAGAGFGGKPRLGVTGRATLRPTDFGMAPGMRDPVELVIDAEFEKAS